MKTTTDMQSTSPVELTMMFVRAFGPVTIGQIEYWLKDQCQFTKTQADAERQAQMVVEYGLGAGWLVRYDEESYVMRIR